MIELQLTYHAGKFPVKGIFVEDPSLVEWVKCAGEFDDAHGVRIFPIPGNAANTVIGALLTGTWNPNKEVMSARAVYEYHSQLFLPHQFTLAPFMDQEEVHSRFSGKPHFFHPVFGLIELSEIHDWRPFLKIKPSKSTVQQPIEGVSTRKHLQNYLLREVDPEASIQKMLENAVPERSNLEDKPLSNWEKLKLAMLRPFFKKENTKERQAETSEEQEKTATKKSWLNRFRRQMKENYEDLEERNKRELDKLMDMFEKDPDAALRYAIPIDQNGTSRGGEAASFKLTRRYDRSGNRYSSGARTGGSVVFQDDDVDSLRSKYEKAASNYEKEGNWERAAFVYMELLSDPLRAANMLEKGGQYEYAASIFLKKCKNKHRAAECYHEGKFYTTAAEIFHEIESYEREGDSWAKSGDREKADNAFNQEIGKKEKQNDFLGAARISREKMDNSKRSQEFLMTGWKKKITPEECLNKYMGELETKDKQKEIERLHGENYQGKDAYRFLNVVMKQKEEAPEISPAVEKVVHETVSRNGKKDPNIVSYLKQLNPSEYLLKDIMRFKRKKY